MKKLLLISFVLIGIQVFAQQTIHVPDDFGLIQDAIETSENGDTILVAPGEYFENIIFRGKAIFITSMFHYSGNRDDITNTIINGSQPLHPDTASCALFINGETQESVLKGFTLTGGTGTRTYNPNENMYFRTGGGIVISAASPTIISNIITHNESINQAGVSGAGGGGMRIGNGNPIIRDNIISYNTGRYAGGLMLAFCGGMELKNNVIAHNTALGDFNGGGGIYIDWQPISFTNNTIVFNHSGDDGGGMIVTGTTATIKNCIIYGNTSESQAPQIYLRYGGNANVTYSNIISSWTGEGNIDDDPGFADTTSYYLGENSVCIDAGNPDAEYNDNENPSQPGIAQPPSMGGLQNDMGAYGGPDVVPVSMVTKVPAVKELPGASLQFSNPYKGEALILNVKEEGLINIELSDLQGKKLKVLSDTFYSPGTYRINLNESEKPKMGLVILTHGNHVQTYKVIF
jgi:hypothetical protein